MAGSVSSRAQSPAIRRKFLPVTICILGCRLLSRFECPPGRMPSQLGEEQWVNRVRLDKTKRGQVNTAFGDGQVSCSEEDSEDDDEPGPGNNQPSEINLASASCPGARAPRRLRRN